MQVREASFPQAPGRRRLRATSTAPSSFILPWGHGDSEGQPRCDPALHPQHPPVQLPAQTSSRQIIPILARHFLLQLHDFNPIYSRNELGFLCRETPESPAGPGGSEEPFPQGRCLVPLHVAPGTRPRGDTAAVPGTARSKPGSKQGQPPTPRAGPAALPKNTENQDQERS